MTSLDQFRRLRSLQPPRPSNEAYSQMDWMLASSAKGVTQAAMVYQKLLEDMPEERAAMEGWEAAPLVDDIEPKKS
jgi:hypothetical protein